MRVQYQGIRIQHYTNESTIQRYSNTTLKQWEYNTKVFEYNTKAMRDTYNTCDKSTIPQYSITSKVIIVLLIIICTTQKIGLEL